MLIAKLQTSFVECYQYREVLANFLSQHLKLKYKRTVLGYLWSLLNPILQLAVLGFVFSHVIGRGMKDYTLYLFSGFLVWTFFSMTLINCAVSLLEAEVYLKKIYLPKMIFPLCRMLVVGVDFLFSFVALAILAAVFGFHFSPLVALVPIAIIYLGAFTLGIGMMVAVATVYFRDVQYLLSVFLNILYYATPILYPMSAIPERFQKIMALNPMAIQVNLFQKLIYFQEMPSAQEWGIAGAISVVTLIAGLIVLNQFEDELIFRM